MKIEKAIEILELAMTGDLTGCSDDLVAADRLGIEALKRLQDMRTSPCTTADEYLPGETEE